ncbi:unnamed protein product [Closterium sp. NIES-54]
MDNLDGPFTVSSAHAGNNSGMALLLSGPSRQEPFSSPLPSIASTAPAAPSEQSAAAAAAASAADHLRSPPAATSVFRQERIATACSPQASGASEPVFTPSSEGTDPVAEAKEQEENAEKKRNGGKEGKEKSLRGADTLQQEEAAAEGGVSTARASAPDRQREQPWSRDLGMDVERGGDDSLPAQVDLQRRQEHMMVEEEGRQQQRQQQQRQQQEERRRRRPHHHRPACNGSTSCRPAPAPAAPRFVRPGAIKHKLESRTLATKRARYSSAHTLYPLSPNLPPFPAPRRGAPSAPPLAPLSLALPAPIPRLAGNLRSRGTSAGAPLSDWQVAQSAWPAPRTSTTGLASVLADSVVVTNVPVVTEAAAEVDSAATAAATAAIVPAAAAEAPPRAAPAAVDLSLLRAPPAEFRGPFASCPVNRHRRKLYAAPPCLRFCTTTQTTARATQATPATPATPAAQVIVSDATDEQVEERGETEERGRREERGGREETGGREARGEREENGAREEREESGALGVWNGEAGRADTTRQVVAIRWDDTQSTEEAQRKDMLAEDSSRRTQMEEPQPEQWQQQEGSRVEAIVGGEMAGEAGFDGGLSGPPSPTAAGNLITASTENRFNSPMFPTNYVTASPCFRSPVAPPSPSLTLSPSPALLPSPAMPHAHSAPRAPSAIPPLPASLPPLPASLPRVTAGLPPLSAGPFSSPEPRTPPAVPRLRFQRNPRSLFGRKTGVVQAQAQAQEQGQGARFGGTRGKESGCGKAEADWEGEREAAEAEMRSLSVGGTRERAEGLGLLDLPQEVVVSAWGFSS